MLFMCMITAVIWYTMQPATYYIIDMGLGILHAQSITIGDTTFNVLKFVTNIWAPAMIVTYVIWFFINAIREDTASYGV